MAISVGSDLAKLHFPGTIHYVNPRHPMPDEDTILISEFGRAVRWGGIALCIYILIVGINLITTGVHSLGHPLVSSFISYATNPILAVLLGIFLTFAVQSSTAVTTITVATVGAGIVPIEIATMVIMGANVGTCFTALLVAAGFYRNTCNLHRALAAAMTHWWFNVLSLLILFPLEVTFRPLTRMSSWLATRLTGESNSRVTLTDFTEQFVHPVVRMIGVDGWLGHVSSAYTAAALTIVLGAIAIIATIRWISTLMTDITAASSHLVLEHSVERRDAVMSGKSLLAGLGLTMMSQSSSATICSTLPFAGTGNLSLRKVLGIVLGANLGTTLTAVLTALAVPGDYGTLALQAALIHVLFNLGGVLVVLSVRPVGRLIFWLSEQAAGIGTRWPLTAFAVMTASYTIIPLGIIALATW
ncbi:Na+/Pi-cotransporter [Corynebacterium kalinowskii]|uniref:Na+/Pi-cotransporter n=1 Tax=Corynebacterium kalinowskii TaxID=2675216 RepID=A0A6B8VDT0_9CORY|nr:Na/Pi symporter [Corynebacterium kalinowskii]QGU01219.1 Na+/Pi-cotransporter [Corynebacterium kalinowskii]